MGGRFRMPLRWTSEQVWPGLSPRSSCGSIALPRSNKFLGSRTHSLTTNISPSPLRYNLSTSRRICSVSGIHVPPPFHLFGEEANSVNYLRYCFTLVPSPSSHGYAKERTTQRGLPDVPSFSRVLGQNAGKTYIREGLGKG